MINKPDRNALRKKRQLRVRNRVNGTEQRPRLNVYRSLNNIYAQIINDDRGETLVTASSLSPEIKGAMSGGNREAAAAVGKLIAARALEKGIKQVVFDRAGYVYHGRVKALADGAREGGLEF
ncbi:50S ribosomal protein L18 [Desulfoscipio gibsoniae]|uniref:Large ribosomal subunit protein uL18 n=1 Tax=Desulfoscipio gibsoniae DSM 7213 TaxID=767817 RepID=R4KBJ8_9FIRM|nr:50S ribosomal protein L18 [Desulfoscipio gibsoniae]AGK99958.1 ribosomal protein L18, bacterial type [Desulfoscipio gibsoniae DSM 7213]